MPDYPQDLKAKVQSVDISQPIFIVENSMPNEPISMTVDGKGWGDTLGPPPLSPRIFSSL